MGTTIFVMVIVMLIAFGVIGAVAMGLQGAGSDKAPELAKQLQRAARHLNGQAKPPQGLVDFFSELPDAAQVKAKVADALPKRTGASS